MTTTTEHDFTRSRWGHNLNIIRWDSEAQVGRAACWVTPPLKDGDIVIVKSEKGSMRFVALEVERQYNVDDMYIFNIVPEELVSRSDEMEEDLWVTKVRRNGGGSSILDIATSKEKAQALADEFNAQYHTDNYFIEKFDETIHAYSRNGE